MNADQLATASRALVQINKILHTLSREQRKFVLSALSALLVKELMPANVRRAIEGTVEEIRAGSGPRPNDCDACAARHNAGLGPCEVHQ